MNQKTVDSFPLTLALSPRGKRVQLENQLRGRGDNRKKIHSIISDRVKYNSKTHSPERRACRGLIFVGNDKDHRPRQLKILHSWGAQGRESANVFGIRVDGPSLILTPLMTITTLESSF